MRVMVTGSRQWRNYAFIYNVLADLEEANDLANGPDAHQLIHGCASGADALARSAAVALGWYVIDVWPDYSNGGFAEANLRRNLAMIHEYDPDIVLAFPTKHSRGTWHAVREARKAGLEVRVYEQT